MTKPFLMPPWGFDKSDSPLPLKKMPMHTKVYTVNSRYLWWLRSTTARNTEFMSMEPLPLGKIQS